MSDPRPLKETDWMRFEDEPNPGRVTRRILVYSKSQGSLLGQISWFGRWRQYVFTPAPETLFNVECLGSLADRLGYLNTMHRAGRSLPSSPGQPATSAEPRSLGRAADCAEDDAA